MKNILVAGAGHGGLSAAAILAKNGYNVTVLEKSRREDIGHDWHDAMDIPAFRFADIPVPPEEHFHRGLQMCYFNPNKTVKLCMDAGPGLSASDNITIDRKYLINYLIDHCEKQGVKFIFEAAITEAVTDETSVRGVKAILGGEEKEFLADMTIDAAGMNSPVRRSLPDSFGIQKDIPEEETFEIYRVYFENTENYITDPNYSVFFFNCEKPGIDWVITTEDYMDVLIGKFGYITDEEIETSLKDLRAIYPGMGTTPIRGGVKATIPLAKTLPLLVADRYALIGDSASMTVPLNGSGIDLSLQAGKLLSSAIMAAEKNSYSKKDLWNYQYRYFKLFGDPLVNISILRRFFSIINADDINFFLEKGLLTEKEIGMAGGNFSAINAQYVIEKAAAALPKAKLVPDLARTLSSLPTLPLVKASMPASWDDKKVQKWVEKYKNL